MNKTTSASRNVTSRKGLSIWHLLWNTALTAEPIVRGAPIVQEFVKAATRVIKLNLLMINSVTKFQFSSI